MPSRERGVRFHRDIPASRAGLSAGFPSFITGTRSWRCSVSIRSSDHWPLTSGSSLETSPFQARSGSLRLGIPWINPVVHAGRLSDATLRTAGRKNASQPSARRANLTDPPPAVNGIRGNLHNLGPAGVEVAFRPRLSRFGRFHADDRWPPCPFASIFAILHRKDDA